ncbi:N-acetylneuraminate synthase family protein [Magnetospirillum sp. 64-120]|uniref:N-acetylneuraminate synthase family protein n=1 Tax=Magnetospirillum sp. 64-120 TaxID=1895778 RepID=UPI0034587C28
MDDGKLTLLQCTSSYPCPDEDVNLRAMETLQREFGLPVEFSGPFRRPPSCRGGYRHGRRHHRKTFHRRPYPQGVDHL